MILYRAIRAGENKRLVKTRRTGLTVSREAKVSFESERLRDRELALLLSPLLRRRRPVVRIDGVKVDVEELADLVDQWSGSHGIVLGVAFPPSTSPSACCA